ncbi:MAG: autoinducer binding domain-containing protein [Erythrobacter sp.]|nr:autoinducer binding domain-containing protein [Erythrobacter sp.]
MQGSSEAMVEALGAISSAPEVVPLRDAVMRALALLGIDAAFFVAPVTADPRVGRVLTNIGCSRVWERHYRARLHLVDPLPRLALDSAVAFVWPDDITTGSVDRKERRYLQIIARHGLARGIGTACFGPQARTGFLGAIWREQRRPSDAVLLAVQQIGQVSFQRYCQIIRDAIDADPLSNRELEVLQWMCRGKSNPVMAQIIGVSRSSIDAYIRRIFAKLNVSDRTAACVKAFSLGYVVTDEIERRVERAKMVTPGAGPEV